MTLLHLLLHRTG